MARRQSRQASTLTRGQSFAFSGREDAKEYEVLSNDGVTIKYKDPQSGGEDTFSVSGSIVWIYT
jgi:hypothetical protein